MKAFTLAFVLFFTTLLPASAGTCQALSSFAEMKEQFKTSNEYVIEGDELQRLFKPYNMPKDYFSKVLLVESTDKKSVVHVAFDKDGCAIPSTLLTWDKKKADKVLSTVGITISWLSDSI